MAVGHDLGVVFYVLVAVHALAALTSFGSIGLGGTYAARAGRLLGGEAAEAEGPQGVEELQRYFTRPARLSLLVLAVPLTGVAAAALRPQLRHLDQVWELLALAVFGLVLGVYGRFFLPAMADLRDFMAQADGAPGAGAGTAGEGRLPPDEAWQAAAAGRAASRAAGACDCLFFVALALMVWQPS